MTGMRSAGTSWWLLTAALLGVGLAMDAFSVSVANGLTQPDMQRNRKMLIAGTFGFFQFLMPVVGWICVRTVVSVFTSLQRLIPWIALILLVWIGGGMIREGLSDQDADESVPRKQAAGQGWGWLLMQGIATSIDALSVGFAFAAYTAVQTLVSAMMIAAETYVICRIGLQLGITAGRVNRKKASVAGGVILILIGAEILIRGIWVKTA